MEMFETWIMADWEKVPWVILSVAVTYIAIVLYTRIVGLRSLSKMTAADFVMTVAVGSLFASTASLSSPSLVVGLTALAGLFAAQWALAWSREKSEAFSKLVDNEPLLLMARSKILDHNLRRANVTRAELFGKLREANALNYGEILAVVFETTGNISVLRSSDANAHLEPEFLTSVIDADQLFDEPAD